MAFQIKSSRLFCHLIALSFVCLGVAVFVLVICSEDYQSTDRPFNLTQGENHEGIPLKRKQCYDL